MAKDRTAHEAARGVKMQTLQGLSSDMITEEEAKLIEESFKTESDRGLALIAASFAELGLLWAIKRRMPDLGEECHKALFDGRGAPLAPFSAKIIMGRSMGIYGPELEKLLNQIRLIRNAFAHALRPLDFKNPRIVHECANLGLPKPFLSPKIASSPRDRYRVTTSYVYAVLMLDAMQQEGKTHAISIP